MNTKDDNSNRNRTPFSNQGRTENNRTSSFQGNNTRSSAPDTNAGSGDSKQAKINLPTGGGAIRGIGEKFEANPVTGTASFSVPLTISEGRGGFTPQLALSYDSGSGNSVFGLGWSVGLPSITRKTDKGLPQYNDNTDNESDTFILSGAEDLVAILDNNGKQQYRSVTDDEITYKVYSYRPRIEGLFAIIERWINQETKISHWRSISKENITSIFGFTQQARIFDLQNERKIFSWLLEESWDAKGNLMKFTYKQENSLNVENTCFEAHRLKKSTSVIDFPNRYLKKVSYGNKSMCTPSFCQSNYTDGFYFDLVFHYGEENNIPLTPLQGGIVSEQSEWAARSDAFSNYKAGFEIRTYRLCQEVLMYHSIENDTPTLVKSTELHYDTTKAFTLLKKVIHCGHNGAEKAEMPALDFSYSEAIVGEKMEQVEESQLRNLPAGVDGQNYQWADLYSEGISGILKQDNNAWYFMPNYGDKRYIHPEIEEPAVTFGGMRSEIPKPAAVRGGTSGFRLDDVDSDGLPELVIEAKGQNGFYSRDEDGKWMNFRNFKEFPNVDFNDNNLRYMDLSGDGLSDIVISKGEYFDIYFSEGKTGYGNYRRVRCSNESGAAPVIVFSDPKKRIFLADMSGDGLTDIVYISHSSIYYFPNMGYGRFGEKVVMSNPPLLDSQEAFDARFVHLADVDGTGTTDLVYISKHKIRYYKNLSGNAWEEELLNDTLSMNATQQTFIQTTDLLGNGTQCLVFTSSLPQKSKQMRYWELTSGIKPFLLNQIVNNMGGVTRLHYASSTKFYMQDKLGGTPWITRLPFAVHVLEKTEIIDLVGNTYFTTRYAYHHGFYDHSEREFRGFGMVEQWDTDELGIRNEELGIKNWNAEDLVPPAYTKTWFHTGFYKNRGKISRQFEEEYYQGDANAWKLPDTIFPDGLNGQEAREACRALKGSPLRIEIYALDGSEKETIPYTVEEKSYNLKCLQHKGENRHAVFLKTDGETLAYHYERNLDDPRISHSLVLQTDEYGNPIRTAQIAYPRRNSVFSEQGEIKVLYTQTEYINKVDDLSFRYIGIPFHSTQYEIFNLNYTGEKFIASELLNIAVNSTEIDPADTPSGSQPQKRSFAEDRSLFWNNDLSSHLDWGQIAFHGLPYQQQTLEFTKKQLDSFGLSFPDMHYWGYLLDGEKVYNQKEISRFDAAAFYLPVSVTDPYGNLTTMEYDVYKLFVMKITQPLNHITIAHYDYRVLQPWKITDPNGNYQSVAFDTLGMVEKLAITGKNGEGDTLNDPTEIYEYDLHSWANEQKPVFAHVSKRETHGNNNLRWLESYVYTDGLGNEIMAKANVADGLAWTIIDDVPTQIQSTDRWLASGKTILNNKGLAVRQYEPWFSDNPNYEFDDRLSMYGVTPVMHYDPLGRLIQTDLPDGTTTKVEFDVWQQKNYDQNDCDVNSPHYNTPQVIDLDILGRPFQTTDLLTVIPNGVSAEWWNLLQNRDENPNIVTTHNTLDILGRILSVKDALGRENMTVNRYGVGESERVVTQNIDSGERSQLIDVFGNRYYRWDSRGQTIMNRYDVLQRPTETLLETAGVAAKLVQKVVYGTNAALNNIGQIAEIWDQDGKTFFEYDFKGNVVKQTKQFAQDYQNTLDWSNNPALINETFIQETTYDALNRPTSLKNPDNKTTMYGYDKGGLLVSVKIDTNTPNISNIEYNENQQRLAVYYGNNTKTKYEYNPLNFRLTRILTTRNTGNDALQDLNYSYDAVGNIIQQTDNAQQTFYFNNQVVTPTGTYEYDALYRLLTATGRENGSLNVPTSADIPISIPVPYGNNLTDLVNYTQNFVYDKLGNIQSVSNVNKWTRDYIYDSNTNRLLKHDTQQAADDYAYDVHGNMLYMPGISQMEWDYLDRLQKTISGNVTSYYNYNSEGNRTRKVVEKQGGIKEIRYYINDYEVYRKQTNNTTTTERITSHIQDDKKRFVLIDTLTIDNGNKLNTPDINIRYQFDNHLGSASLELDETGNIISYEEYHPFGTSSYRLGRNATEVQLKRYRYVGKERDEETGLYYYGSRYYAAWICRFVNVDPLQFDYPELTPFQYASNRPITGIDMDGLEFDYVPTIVTNPVDEQGGLGSQVRFNKQNMDAAIFKLEQDKELKENYNTPKKQNTQTTQSKDFAIIADQTASQATPLLITMEQLEESILTPRQLEIKQYIKENQWRNQVTLSNRNDLKNWADAMPAPIRNATLFDPVIKATSIGGATITSGLLGKEIGIAVVSDAISIAPKVYSTTTNIYNTAVSFYGTTAGQVTAGATGGFILNLLEETPPDLNMPDPVSNTVFQGINLLREYGKKITQPTFSTDSTQSR
jgi:RHS repeat-associated protein